LSDKGTTPNENGLHGLNETKNEPKEPVVMAPTPPKDNWTPKDYVFKPLDNPKDHSNKNESFYMKPDAQRPSSNESLDRGLVSIETPNNLREAKLDPLSYSKIETASSPAPQTSHTPSSQQTPSSSTELASGLTGRTLIFCPKGYGSIPEGDKCPFGFKRGEKYQIEGVHFDGDKLFV
jgi:hypothetical protein